MVGRLFGYFQSRGALLSELEAERRKLAVAETEIASMAAVIARDRARVKAETAEANLRTAKAEGKQHVG